MNKHIGSNFDDFMKKEIMDDHEAGKIDGLKLAFDLMGQLGDFYANNIGIDERASDEEKELHKNVCQAQANACRYGQHVIRQGEWKDEGELPW